MQVNSIDSLFGIKPKIAVLLGFGLLLAILLLDIVSPDDYRFVLFYLFPAAIITLNAKSMKVVIAALIISTLFENYFLFRDGYFPLYFTKIEVFNISIRFLSTLLIVWLARSLRRSQLRVNLLANTDSLTGLWNRRWARIMIEQAIAKLAEDREVFSVALIDVNDFKKINDIHGHLVGDQVLTKIAHTLMTFSSENTIFFRLGGDEFLIVASKVNEQQMNQMCSDIVQTVNRAMNDSGYPATLSIGMATYSEAPRTVSEILHEVDLEMYRHKTEGKNTQ
ncbi:GGDEF domain-containing protein [Polynucleobacter sp. AP-Reno-20A-A9]|uniref:GGDEF domain-containing protein n=1 Tax=Polynucleobacter sp. AP-Reno-20A-A9 TaxID=2576925 RepID=UPI001C0DA56E|nr:GGDEF domain-containing protein [Polynucleobacter sp. AP-Reno-20A-A9]MBU3629107.1 GGDEF domain-containing protein [Polynucleobacter sp. AP-Reno-20A-A9]